MKYIDIKSCLKSILFTPFFLVLFIFTDLFAQNATYHLDSLTTAHGLSNNTVFCVYQDTRGFIWLGTRTGLNRFDGANFKIYEYSPEDSTSLSNNYVWDIQEDSFGDFWVGTTNGLNRYDRFRDAFKRYSLERVRSDSIRRVAVRVIFEDMSQNLWLGTTNGLERYDRERDEFIHYSIDTNDLEKIQQNFVISIFEDNKNQLWIGTRHGLFKYDPVDDQLYFENELSRLFEEKERNVSAVFQDHTGTYWIGSWGHRYILRIVNVELSKAYVPTFMQKSKHTSVFVFFKASNGDIWVGTDLGLLLFNKPQSASGEVSPLQKLLNYKKIRCIMQDKSGIIWVATEFSGVYRFIPRFKKFNNYEIPVNKLIKSRISVITEDENNIFWIGTHGLSLWQFDRKSKKFAAFKDISGIDRYYYVKTLLLDKQQLWIGADGYNQLVRYDIKNNKFSEFFPEVTKKVKNGLGFTALLQDRQGFIWIGTDDSGLIRLDLVKNEFVYFLRDPDDPASLSSNRIAAIYEDRKGFIWIATSGGGLNKYLPEANQFVHYRRNPHQKNSLSDDILFSIHEDKSGILWLGTGSGGLNRLDPETGEFEHFDQNNNFPSNRIYGILEDSSGNLWISSTQGITKFNPATRAVRNYDKSDGLPANEFDSISFLKCKSGEMMFGSRDGFTIFHPDSLLDNLYLAPVYLTDLKILNQPAKLDTAICEKKHLVLEYEQNVFSFEFAALNYINSEKNQYRYKMEGFDKAWQHAANRRYASYSNLRPGNYTFRVQASNNDGFWNRTGASLGITVLPPWWQTRVAYFIYFLLTALAIWGFYRFTLNRAKIRNELAMQRFETNKIREIDEMKSRFFANISHEFRTPLTLIIGPIEDFLADSTTAKFHKAFKLMHRNAKRLQKLINQLLDLSRLETGSLKLQLTPQNVTRLVRAQVNSFLSHAERNKIKLCLDTGKEDILGTVDHDVIEKVVANLLSNAFKFTRSGGEISVSLDKTAPSGQEFLVLLVTDNGIGIPPEKQKEVFRRFYQIDTSMTRSYEGSGIGLSLTKELVELHGGDIRLESEVGQGTTFFVNIPLGETVIPDKADPVSEANTPDPEAKNSERRDQRADGMISLTAPSHTILVVDDNDDVRHYIGDCLQPNYKILYASNGEEALAKTTAKLPDLIVSDVMMPVMDGFALCRQIKTDEYTCHIPVILLTAKAAEENKLEGLETGADDYLIKPFNKSELKIRVKNLIEQRERLRRRFANEASLNPAKVTVSSMDEKFLQRAIEIVKSHLTDESFNVDLFAQEIGMSRQHLNRKLKAVTDFPTRDFVRYIRLKQAAVLLKNNSATVTEIAYEVGFTNPSYFTECFKKQFGCLPSEY